MSILKIASGTNLDNNFVEGVVSSVDPIRMFCQVKTSKGQNLSNVAWLLPSGGNSRSSSIVTPVIGDRVLVTNSTGYPIILGFLPKVLEQEAFPVNINSGVNLSDTGNFSPLGRGLHTAPNKPSDLAVGDIVTTSSGGGLIGLLRGGSIVLKSSKLAQIIISKYDDLVRIVGRNYEAFSDLSSKVHVSVRGRIYGFLGIADTLANSRNGFFKYKEYLGDTSLAEHLKDTYIGADSASFPAANTIIKKQLLVNQQNNPLMIDTLDLSGESKKIVQGIPGSGKITTEDQLEAEYKVTSVFNTAIGMVDITPATVTVDCRDGTFSKAVFTKDSAVVDHNGISKATFTGSSIVVDHNGSSTATFTGDSIVISQGGAAVITLNGSGVECTFGGHFVKVNSSGVQLG